MHRIARLEVSISQLEDRIKDLEDSGNGETINASLFRKYADAYYKKNKGNLEDERDTKS
jgi:hypothetical protein|tara:strand:- start:1295 stop:1471 length:177 start_codon:yes stop_codon:yes gene_type:complete